MRSLEQIFLKRHLNKIEIYSHKLNHQYILNKHEDKYLIPKIVQ